MSAQAPHKTLPNVAKAIICLLIAAFAPFYAQATELTCVELFSFLSTTPPRTPRVQILDDRFIFKVGVDNLDPLLYGSIARKYHTVDGAAILDLLPEGLRETGYFYRGMTVSLSSLANIKANGLQVDKTFYGQIYSTSAPQIAAAYGVTSPMGYTENYVHIIVKISPTNAVASDIGTYSDNLAWITSNNIPASNIIEIYALKKYSQTFGLVYRNSVEPF